jgi:hypothetical protein
MKRHQLTPRRNSIGKVENIPSSSEIRKIVGASNRFGNPGIQNQQLTTMETQLDAAP